MKIVCVTALCLLSTVLGFSQDGWQPHPAFVANRCHGAVISEGAAAEKVKQLAHLLDGGDLAAQTYLIQSDVINAWTVPADDSHSFVCVPLALVLWFRGADGELAYIIAHEYGHATDEACASSEGRAKLARKSKSPFGLLFGTSNGDELGDSRRCELRADVRAFMFMAQAGLDTDDATAALKKLQGARHDHRKGAIGRLFAINDTHPLLSDRIRQLERLRESFRRATEQSQ